MRTVILGASALGLVGLLAALQVLARLAQRLPFEPFLRPLTAVDRSGRSPRPPELIQLEVLVADVAQGDPAAAARLAARLRSVGLDPGPAADPGGVLAALRLQRAPLRHDVIA